MGQISSSYTDNSKKHHKSPYFELDKELSNSTIPKGVGSFSPTKEKKWVNSDKAISFIKSKGAGGEIKTSQKEALLTGGNVERALRLRSMGFLPEQILDFFRLEKDSPINNISSPSKEDVNSLLDTEKPENEDELGISTPSRHQRFSHSRHAVNAIRRTGGRLVRVPITEKPPVKITWEGTKDGDRRILRGSKIIKPVKATKLPEVVVEMVAQNEEMSSIKTEDKPLPQIEPIAPQKNNVLDLKKGRVTESSDPITVSKPYSMKDFSIRRTNNRPSTPNPLTRVTHEELLNDDVHQAQEVPVEVKKEIKQEFSSVKIETRPRQISLEEELSMKMISVDRLLKTRLAQLGTVEGISGPTGKDVSARKLMDDVFNTDISIKRTESWRDLIEEGADKVFLNDITTLSEELLISKYVSSRATTGNPSSWSTVSTFDAFEILQNPNPVYGLTDEQRLSVSELIAHMEKLTSKTNLDIKISKNLTIHMLYEQTRRNIASLDKLEQN